MFHNYLLAVVCPANGMRKRRYGSESRALATLMCLRIISTLLYVQTPALTRNTAWSDTYRNDTAANGQMDGWMADARIWRLSVVFVLLRHDGRGCGEGRGRGGGRVLALLTCAPGSRWGHVVSLLCHTDAWNLSYAP